MNNYFSAIKCKDNEVFELCPPKCPPQDCGIDPALILCAPNPKIGDSDCEPSCRCKDGFSKDDFGNCIPTEKCRKFSKYFYLYYRF